MHSDINSAYRLLDIDFIVKKLTMLGGRSLQIYIAYRRVIQIYSLVI